MTDACRAALIALRLQERLRDVHQDLLEALLTHDAGLTVQERRRGVRVLEWLKQAHDALGVLGEEGEETDG